MSEHAAGLQHESEPSREELLAKIALLEQKQAVPATLNAPFKVGEKGGISVYGFGRFPVTLYESQWPVFLLTVTGMSETDLRAMDAPIFAFIDENRDKLAPPRERKNETKLQNTIVKAQEEALVKVVRELRKTGMTVAQAEEKARAILKLT